MRGQKDQEKQAELSKWGPRPYMRHEVIPQGLIENQRLRVSDEAPGAGREKKKKPPLNLPLAGESSGRQSQGDLSGHSGAAGNHI